MVKTSIEKIAEQIGFDIAHSDDETQGNLLNGLSRGLKLLQPHLYENQLSYVSNKLSKDSEKLILDLSEFIKLKNK